MLKKKVFVFPQIIRKDNIPLQLLNLNINGLTLKCESSVKFLGVKIDENLTWRDHINIVENEIAKNRFPQILFGPFLNTLSHMYMLIEIMET